MNAHGSRRLNDQSGRDAPAWVLATVLLAGLGLTAVGLFLLWVVFLGEFLLATGALLGWLVVMAAVTYSWLRVVSPREAAGNFRAADGAARTEDP